MTGLPDIDTSDVAFIFNLGLVIGANPDKIYEKQGNGCAYVHRVSDDTNELCDGCLIGTILVKMGVPREWFIECSLNTGNGASTVMSELGFNRRVLLAADVAQISQDGGNPWSVAGEAFISHYNNLDRD
jgi:hypothetical protein